MTALKRLLAVASHGECLQPLPLSETGDVPFSTIPSLSSESAFTTGSVFRCWIAHQVQSCTFQYTPSLSSEHVAWLQIPPPSTSREATMKRQEFTRMVNDCLEEAFNNAVASAATKKAGERLQPL